MSVSEVAETLGVMSLAEEPDVCGTEVLFKVHGMDVFSVEMDLAMPLRDVKKLLQDDARVEPEHMRLIYKDKVLKDADTLETYNAQEGKPVHILFTAGHTALMGGTKPPPRTSGNPFVTPVRGISGSKGERPSRMSGRRGGMAIIRKYGIMMKRQEFREKAPEIGFIKYR
mmetsp:Transcript_63065/g.124707  ORF Transcript_63065/g.124707 Transcript_63065/m.124707 type:complete len:170 (+) Transcript_63065:82-591(+)